LGALATAVAVSSGPLPVPDAAAAVVGECADADGNGDVSVTDGVQALRAVAGLPSPCTDFRCDVNGSGDVTLTDGVLILAQAADLRPGNAYHCPVPTSVHDFSDFRRFELSRESALGFCAPIGSVFHVVVARRTDGAYDLQSSVAEERAFGDPDCVDPFFPLGPEEKCLAAVPRPDRVLTADELASLQSAFGEVRTVDAPDPQCAILAFDPCVIDTFRWDDVAATDFRCHGRRVSFERGEQLTAVLDALIVDPTPTPSPIDPIATPTP
jgi:hypothetical protein